MRRNNSRRACCLSLLVLFALVLCQFALVMHEADLKQHLPGGHCEYCVAAAPLHAALGAGAWGLPPADASHVYVAHTPGATRVFHIPVYFSRAPPLLFFC